MPFTLSPEDRIPFAKLVATGAIAFAVIPVSFAHIKPGYGLFLSLLLVLIAMYLWSDAQTHFAALAGSNATVAGQTQRAMRALELAAIVTAMLVGTIVGALVSLFFRDPA
jgi:hypothetical protein